MLDDIIFVICQTSKNDLLPKKLNYDLTSKTVFTNNNCIY